MTDDTLQDEWSVMCAKSEVYSKHIPARCLNVWFLSDGAGCFSSQMNRMVQPLWESWTGIFEQRYMISPCGGDNSSLDGMFAKCMC